MNQVMFSLDATIARNVYANTEMCIFLRQNYPQGINLSLMALRMTSHSSRQRFESAVVVSSVGRLQLITTTKSDSLHMKAQKQTLEQEVAQHCQCDSLMTLT